MDISLNQLQTIRPNAHAFTLLGLQPKYIIDSTTIDKHYHIVMQELHPDRFVNASPPEKVMAAQMTAWVNQAYPVLKDPILRAQEIMKIKGLLNADLQLKQQNSAILFELMEQTEAMHDLDISSLPNFLAEVQKNIEGYAIDFQKAFDEDNADALSVAFLKLNYTIKLERDAQIRLAKDMSC